MQSPGKISRLLHLLYQAAADPDAWTPFLDELAGETDATGSFILALPQDDGPVFYRQSGLSGPALHAMPAPLAAARAPLSADGPFARGVFYDDSIQPAPKFHQAASIIEAVAGYAMAGIALVRPPSIGPFEGRATSLLRLLAPHLRQSLLLHGKLTHLHQQASVSEHALEATATACLLLDSRGFVQSLSSAASRLLAENDGLVLAHGRMQATLPREDRALEQALYESPGRPAQLRITRRAPRRPVHLVAASHPGAPDASPLTTVFLIDPDSRTPPRGPLLRSIFGLTPSEAKLAGLLAEGHDVKCCAERMRITEASARFVLKRIFQKTAVKSQSALMRLILSFPSLPAESAALRQ